jgi:hypothetical protein
MNNTSRGELSTRTNGRTWIYVALTVFGVMGCGPGGTPACPDDCPTMNKEGLERCDPELGCDGPDEPPSALATLSVSILNASSVPRTFTLGASVMNSERTIVFANVVPLSGVVMQPGEMRRFPAMLSTPDAETIFVVGAVGYDVSVPASHAQSNPVIGATIGAHACTFVYEETGGARMTSECY